MGFTPEDLAYIEAEYRTLDALAPPEALAGLTLPGPTYVLPDGRRMYPRDLLRLVEETGPGGDVRAAFARRFAAAAAEHGETVSAERIEEEWRGYLDGSYGACLREVTPENIYRKERLAARLTAQLAEPRLDDEAWRARLREDVAALDALERPFTSWDRERFGGSVSRDRLIAWPRRAWPWIFDGSRP